MLKTDHIIHTFVIVDDFFHDISQHQPLLPDSYDTRGPNGSMAPSEIATICLLFQLSGFRNFKTFYRFLEL